jgi:anti-anti-sigma factor
MTQDESSAFGADAAEQGSGAWRVVARGELDVATADELARTLDPVVSGGASLVVLDLSDVTFLDSSGLRTIVRSATSLEEGGGRLVVDGVSPAVARVLEVTGLLERLRGDGGAAAEAPT